MNLTQVEIVNFRSIRDVSIKFEPRCRILVGINESGKSNILKALSLLDPARKVSRKDDLRELLPDENDMEEAYVRFYFRLTKAETDAIASKLRPHFLSDAEDPAVVIKDGRVLTVSELCAEQNEFRYFVDLAQETKEPRVVKFGDTIALTPGWSTPTIAATPYTISHNGAAHNVSNFTFVHQRLSVQVPSEAIEPSSLGRLHQLYAEAVRDIAAAQMPSTLFWEYDEKNLLPSSVALDAFATDPNTCVPLKNMFFLAGHTNIRAELERLKGLSPNRINNFFGRIAEQATAHFQSVWKEYQEISFSLRPEGPNLIPGIREKNSYDLSKRSDGFKRFVTFLLIVSLNVKTEVLKDALLLIDEPDYGLHPSGARYLRDELIRIGATNSVVYSTHSIFMIDTGDIGRHYIVEKKNEVTRVKTAETSNVADEEVLYNALGFSLFEVLKQHNFVFEGWRDKRLYEVALTKASGVTKKALKDVGVCHAKGAKHIKAITPMIELAKRKCVILSDADQPAKDQRKLFQQEKGYGDWKIYQDVDANVTAVTGEDFLKSSYIAAQLASTLKDTGIAAPDEGALPASDKLQFIHNWLAKSGMKQDQAAVVVKEVKGALFDNLSAKDIEATYYGWLDSLAALIAR